MTAPAQRRPALSRARRGSWWRDAVVYEVYPRSFADSDGDGVGDLGGLLARIDHLAWLGVGALWLCPVYPSPQRDNGYDVADHCAVDPRFGTLADLDAVVDEAHRRGIRVVLDQVLHHTSDQHPWFREAAGSLAAPRHDWYLWRPPRSGHVGGTPGAEPTNWGAAFGGSAWTWEPATGRYRLGLFSPWQPDLDWSNPDVRAALADVLRWWRGRGVDGFRLDVINLVDKPPVLRDGPVPPGARYADGVALCAGGPRLPGYLRELRDAADRAPVRRGRPVRPDDAVLLLGEAPGTTPAQAATLTDPRAGGLDMVLQFEHAELDREPARWRRRPFDLRDLKAWARRWQSGPDPWPALFLGNHDQARIASRYGSPGRWQSRSAALWAVLLHAHRGTPFLYQGDEIGMANRPLAGVRDVLDVEARGVLAAAVAAGEDADAVLDGLRALGRDHARVPVAWDAGRHGGFTTGTPWMPAHPDSPHRNVAAQRDDPASVLALHRALLRLRRDEPALVDGDITVLLPDHRHVYAVERRLGATTLLVVANVSGEASAWPGGLDRAAWASATVLLTTSAVRADGDGPHQDAARPARTADVVSRTVAEGHAA
ncbi:glycoside hydrolase family 13 protein, partial [Cellulomonas hominis]|uniref:glycoside hydrolase family 13 protein n=1 Tax=Cellulomonas hominis TaxID=156981 RepID=UPI001BD007EA